MNIMVRLKNIQRKDNLIEADFYPEGSKIAGHIVVDLTTVLLHPALQQRKAAE